MELNSKGGQWYDAFCTELNTANRMLLGSDRQLGASLSGVNLVNAAEILRYEWDGWSDANITRFENMIATLFVPAASYISTANDPNAW